jgi:TRAP-type C4-dicarboxylate transport system permease small subunit
MNHRNKAEVFWDLLKSVDGLLGKALRILSAACLIILLLLLAGNVLNRFLVPLSGLHSFSFGWFDEIVEWSFAWMVFFGAAALWREKEHFEVDWLSSKLKGKTGGFLLEVVLELISLSFFLVFTLFSLRLTARADDWTPIFKLPKKLLYLCLPASGILMSLYSVRNLAASLRELAGHLRRR